MSNSKQQNQKWKAMGFLITGIVFLILLVVILFKATHETSSIAHMTTIVFVGLIGFISLVIGVNFLRSYRKLSRGEDDSTGDFSHAYPLFGIVLALLVMGLIAREFLVPPSYGQFGNYRGDAVEEATEKLPTYTGRDACGECHEEELTYILKDTHAQVECELCHGPGTAHIKNSDNAMVIPDGKDQCLLCHNRLNARPGAFPQIDWREHFQSFGVEDETTRCVQCHSPHEPLFLERNVRESRLHPLIHRCQDCHIARTETDLERPSDHPEIFTCDYCHQDIVNDFQERNHQEISCTTCHIFMKLNDFSGRILRDADPRFCLLCHRMEAFKTGEFAPGISWPEHRDDVSESPEDFKKHCTDCHQMNIHILHGGSE